MGRTSKTKGAAFERLVARKIVRAAGAKPADCFRTPLSGGHVFGKKLDLQMKPRLLKVFPFDVECKHDKRVCLEAFAKPAGFTTAWLNKLRRQARPRLAPLLVFRGNRTEIYCAVDRPVLGTRIHLWSMHCPQSAGWVVYKFEDFLKGAFNKK